MLSSDIIKDLINKRVCLLLESGFVLNGICIHCVGVPTVDGRISDLTFEIFVYNRDLERVLGSLPRIYYVERSAIRAVLSSQNVWSLPNDKLAEWATMTKEDCRQFVQWFQVKQKYDRIHNRLPKRLYNGKA